MFRALSVLLLFSVILSADEVADRKAIDTVIVSLFAPQVRSDPKRMAELTTADFDGDLDSIPVHTVWCETSCAGFKARSLKFVTTDVAVLDGEITMGAASMSEWLMILKRDGPVWRISSIHSIGRSPFARANRRPGN